MTQVSDAALAIAADKAGIVGSISCPGKSSSWIRDEIKKFIKERKHRNFVFAIGTIESSIISLLRIYKPRYVVLLDRENSDVVAKTMSFVRNYGGEIIYRISDIDFVDKTLLPDYYTLKGHESAGKFNNKLTTIQMAKIFKERYSDVDFICTGGLYTREDVEKCFKIGACAVEIGTPFAVSKESCLDEQTKLSMLNNSKYFVTTHWTGIEERIHSPNKIYDLESGVKDITKGHVFIGKKANELPKTIRTVEEIAKVLLPNR